MENPFVKMPRPRDDLVTRDDHRQLKREVDALQIEVMSRREKWFRSPSVIVSGLALCFSLATTVLSHQREDAADARAARAELRSILQRLIELPLEKRRFLDDFPGEQHGLAGNYTEEGTLLIDQVARIANRYPEMLSAAEYYALAMASDRAALTRQSREFMETAVARNPDVNIHLMLLRGLAEHRYHAGDAEEGARFFQQALDLCTQHPDLPPEVQSKTNGFTLILWAQACGDHADPRSAHEHCDAALKLAETLPPDDGRRELISLSNQLREKYAADLPARRARSRPANADPGGAPSMARAGQPPATEEKTTTK